MAEPKVAALLERRCRARVERFRIRGRGRCIYPQLHSGDHGVVRRKQTFRWSTRWVVPVDNRHVDDLARTFHAAYGEASRNTGWGGPGWQAWDVLPEAGREATRTGVLALLRELDP